MKPGNSNSRCIMADPRFFAADSNRPGGAPRRTVWKRGDRVLAPWEPTFLYAGTMDQVTAGRALINFDDGDAGWVDLAFVQPLALQCGQRVMSRRRMGPHFFPGEIREVDGEQVHVEFDDGKEERTTVASLRIPCQPLGRGAEQVKATSHLAFLEHLQEGDRVWALWNPAALFPGTVNELRDREVDVHFDDGDQAWVQLEHVLPLDLIVGMFVMCRSRIEQCWLDSQFHPGTITDTEGDRVLIRYDDGDEEWTTAAALALPVPRPPAAMPPPAPADVRVSRDPAGLSNGWNPSTVLWVGGFVVAAVAALFYWLGSR